MVSCSPWLKNTVGTSKLGATLTFSQVYTIVQVAVRLKEEDISGLMAKSRNPDWYLPQVECFAHLVGVIHMWE